MENLSLRKKTERKVDQDTLAKYELNLEKLVMIMVPHDPGRRIETYLKISIDDGKNTLRIPEHGGHSLRDISGQNWKIGCPFYFNKNIVIEIWESDSKRKDDFYSPALVFSPEIKEDQAICAGNLYHFDLYYSIKKYC